jgi:hypothetical protein
MAGARGAGVGRHRRALTAVALGLALPLAAGCTGPSRRASSVAPPLVARPSVGSGSEPGPAGSSGPAATVPPAGTSQGGGAGPGDVGPVGASGAARSEAAAVAAAKADLQAVDNQLSAIDGQLGAAARGVSATEPDPSR